MLFNWRKLPASNPLGKLAVLRPENCQSFKKNTQEAFLGSRSPTTRCSQEQKGKRGHPCSKRCSLRRPQVSRCNSPPWSKRPAPCLRSMLHRGVKHPIIPAAMDEEGFQHHCWSSLTVANGAAHLQGAPEYGCLTMLPALRRACCRHWERRLLRCSSSEAPVLKMKPKDGLNEPWGSLLACKGTGPFRLLAQRSLCESLCPCTAAEQHGQYCKLWRLPVSISHPQVTTTLCVPDSGLFIKACSQGCNDSC